ncbi:MAG: acyl-CoA dehydrogenase family protein [Candidatus Obscuribacterales bacterium]|nr:acyl-CoA dehydrogenase family protein [Cyanobacteria bacterium SZAS LIN-5]
MNTFLSESQESLKETYAAFAKEQILPVANKLEDHSLNLKEFIQKLGQNGYLGITVPKEYGGTGGNFIDLIVFVEAVSQYDAGLGLSLAAHYGVVELINKFGSDVQNSRYLPLLARGECVGALAINEHQAGTDVMAVAASTAGGALSGEKTWVVNGSVANLFAVLARGENAVEFRLVDASGDKSVSVGPDKPKLGLRSAATNDINFDKHQLGKDSLIADGKAEEALQYVMNVAKVIAGAAAVGLVDAALEHSAEHARNREQFGQKISQFQGIQWKLADMSTECAAARLLTYRAAWSKELKPEEFARDAAMTKLFASKVARVHSSEAVQILGSLGIMSDNPVERAYRDSKVLEIAEGTSEAQKLVLVKELGI